MPVSLPVMLLLAAGVVAQPLEPELIAPADGAVVQSPVVLQARVEDSDGAALEVDLKVRPVAPDAAWEPFSVAVVPDTQFYVYESAGARVENFEAMTSWIADQREAENIVFATHLGDVVQTWDDGDEWDRALGAMEGLGTVPHGIVVGNHDCDFPTRDPEIRPECMFDQWFPTSRYEAQEWWGGSLDWEGAYSAYQLIEAGGLDLLFLQLSHGPNSEDLAWAAGVIEAHPDRVVIISTHWYLATDGTVVQDAQAIQDALVTPFDNVWFVLSAHTPGEARRSDTVAGHPVHSLLSCYQSVDERIHMDGTLRLMRFEPAEGRVQVETYSAVTEVWEDGDDSSFALDFPVFPYEQKTVEAVASGALAEAELALEPGDYEWTAVARDADGVEASAALLRFTVEAGPEDTGEPDTDHPGDSGDSGAPGDTGDSDVAPIKDPPYACHGCSGAHDGGPGALWPWLLGLLALGLHTRRAGRGNGPNSG